ncbi:alpha-L-arabinofuranosidase B-like protein [Kineococcus xinjiangensis]|uniref:Alpha-L-arabinofuranosidase B-like protein n=1 Tax=Kineococcus xinjiangensis TaxID=512762 RepID=A0A2S6IDX7_9ACTN|nr:glycoside hydrolase family 43 protein [Kineococcus xinjiangensis]PPK92425.1 alpha-L-arabinofuranosidase B-like protein [Kineococcus xinjiangensis]
MPELTRRTALGGALALVASASVLNAPAASAAITPAAYVMGYFAESPNWEVASYGLHLAVSRDGLEWTPLNQNNPVVLPTAGTGGLRDPYIHRKQDNTFVVLATDLKGTNWAEQNQYIHVWDSTDLRSFTGYRRIKLHSLPTHSWAPEVIWDAGRRQYGIVYSANDGNRNVLMVNYTTDFRTVGGHQVYFDPGFNVIDGSFAFHNGMHYLYFKREHDFTLMGARSSSLAPGSFDRGVFTGAYRGPIGTEAPTVVKAIGQNVWYLWGDNWAPRNGYATVWRTTDLAAGTWSPVSNANFTQPMHGKHQTITEITQVEYDNLLARWGTPAWNRLKSHNFPDHFVRHANNVGRIDQYPFDPYRDSMWRLVPGLAASTGVSFESVNFPGRFLRHSGFVVGLAPNDGSAGFRADATFHRTSGLADSRWTSFRSHNFPTRYLRHSAFALRIDEISSASALGDRRDATFRIGY